MNQITKKDQIIVSEPKGNSMTPEYLKKMVAAEVKNRTILTKFITDHMKEGVDFGRIHMSKNCENKYTCTYNAHPSHWSKPSLFKPGSEKFSSLMKLRPEYHQDIETYQMAGSPAGLFCFVCYLKDIHDRVIGEGRGAASVGPMTDVNKAIKMAEKRAKVDAVLSTGGLSDFFTQDLEDGGFVDDLTPKTPAKSFSQQRPSQVKIIPMSDKQKGMIKHLLLLKGKTQEELETVCKKTFGAEFKNLGIAQASQIISRLQLLPDYVETPAIVAPITDEDLDVIDEAISGK